MNKKKPVVIALVSMSLLALELAWTRLFSAEFFYTFAFLILSLAVLGLGLGALALHASARLQQPKHLPAMLALCALTMLSGPPAVFRLGLDFSTIFADPIMAGKLVGTILVLCAPYFFAGMALAGLFKADHQKIARLYAADLVGAGLGVMLILPLMNLLGTPLAALACAGPVLLALFLTALRWSQLVPIGIAALMAVISLNATSLLQRERVERAPVLYTHWDAMAKVKLYDFKTYRGLNIDNAANSPVFPFDGDWEKLKADPYEFGIDVQYLIKMFDHCTFLSLGAGGGTDVLQALQAGAEEVHAVEVVPHINAMMVDGVLAGYSGRIYRDPRVIVATDDARSYVRRHKDTFDVIYSLSTNTFAALASGSFAMAESYLFTTEAFGDYWRSLSEGGFMMMEHQFYMPRLAGEVMGALEREGVRAPAEHVAFYDLPSRHRNLLLLSKRPLTEEIRNRAFGELTEENYEQLHLLYPAPEKLEDNLINQVVLKGWNAASADAAIDLSPCSDDRPFTPQLGMWKNFKWEKLSKLSAIGEVRGFPLAKTLIALVLAVITLFIVPLNLLPLFGTGRRLRAVPWLYLFVIGMAYMMVEVILIQKYALFIGPSIYSILTVLLALLVFSGLGSAIAGRMNHVVVFLGICTWLLLDVFVFKHLFYPLAHFTQPARILTTVAFLAPLGFFMGMPFPKAGLRVGDRIAWGFAVNGAASVFGATAVLLIAFSFGFSAALLLALGFYLGALALYSWETAWRDPQGPGRGKVRSQ